MNEKLSRRNWLEKVLVTGGILATMPIAGFSNYAAPPNNIDDLEDLKQLENMLKSKTPIKWIFNGDSITMGAKHTHGLRSYPEIAAERIRYELKRFDDIIINTAISGNTTQSILKGFDWRVTQFKPCVVSLMIGTNDAANNNNISPSIFYNNLQMIVKKIRDIKAIPILHTPSLIIIDKADSRKQIEAYVEKIKLIAQKYNLILVDNWHYWQQLKNQLTHEQFLNLLNDEIHPNGYGHAEIAQQFFKAINVFDSTASTCKIQSFK